MVANSYIKLHGDLMKRLTLKFLFLGVLFNASPSFGSSILDEHDLSLSYEIYSTSPYRNRKELNLSIDLPSLKWNVGADCSGFDAGISVEGLMNDLDSQFNRMQKDVVNGIKGFATQLPLLLIQRQDPGMYELISNGIIKGEEIFNLSVQSCESMAASFSKDGFSAMGDESFWYEFSSSLSNDADKEEVDVVKSMKDKGTQKGEAGVPKFGGGTCGNNKSNPCRPVEEVVEAGIEIAFKNELEEKSLEGHRKSWIKNVFEDGDSANDWILKTLGTVEYGTCSKCDKYNETVGTGVYGDIANESFKIADMLSGIVNNNEIPTKQELLNISVNDLFVDENVIYALRDETVHKSIFINRIADDLALMKVVDKLLAARRVLISGKSDPSFQSVSINKEIIEEKVKLVSDEISLLREELALKSAAKGDSIVYLMNRYKQRRSLDFRNSNQGIDKEVVDNLKRMTGRGN